MTAQIAPAPASDNILCAFPGSPAQAYVGFRIDFRLSLSSADLRAIRVAVFGLPLPGYDVIERQGYNLVTRSRWVYAYVVQVNGPPMSNFSIARDRATFRVCLDDGLRITARWRGFSTISRAVAAIGKHVDGRRDAPSLDEHACWPSDSR